MKEIHLSKGQVALVDDEDYDFINQWRWRARWNENTQSFYAVRHSATINGERHTVSMHRLLLGLHYGDTRQGDHKEPAATLDNRRANLRIATPAQNMANRRGNKNGTSRLKGVCWHKQSGKWNAQIAINGIPKSLGLFTTEEAAHAAYCAAAVELRGECARSG